MTYHVLFIQGGGDEGTHDQWDNKLADSLRANLGDGYGVRYPLMPNEADPHYERWAKAIADESAALGDGVILGGHSIGATILIASLATGRIRVRPRAVFLVAAPYIGDGGWPSDEIAPMTDLGTRLPAGVPVFLYHGDQDETAPPAHLDLYAKAIPHAAARLLKGCDHQLNNDLAPVARDVSPVLPGPDKAIDGSALSRSLLGLTGDKTHASDRADGKPAQRGRIIPGARRGTS